jgi:hypothetical protein
MLIAVFTRARDCSISSASWISVRTVTPYFPKIRFNIIIPSTSESQVVFSHNFSFIAQTGRRGPIPRSGRIVFFSTTSMPAMEPTSFPAGHSRPSHTEVRKLLYFTSVPLTARVFMTWYLSNFTFYVEKSQQTCIVFGRSVSNYVPVNSCPERGLLCLSLASQSKCWDGILQYAVTVFSASSLSFTVILTLVAVYKVLLSKQRQGNSHSKKQSGPQLVRFPDFSVAGRFIAMFTRTRHWPLSWARWTPHTLFL